MALLIWAPWWRPRYRRVVGGTAAGPDGRARRIGLRQAFLIAETSNSRVTLSLTRTPPVSSVAFQVMP